jgi:hypothetical protein
MKLTLCAVAFFLAMTVLLFKAKFQIELSPAQYAFAVVWNACLAASLAVLLNRMATPQRAHQGRARRSI